MSDYDYAWEKLRVAVQCLAGTGSQKYRLLDALISALSRINPDDDLPPEIREDFEQLMKDMRQLPAVGQDGRYKITVDSLSDDAVSEAINQVMNFYDVVCRHREPAD